MRWSDVGASDDLPAGVFGGCSRVYVEISVMDTGTGMTDKICKRLNEAGGVIVALGRGKGCALDGLHRVAGLLAHPMDTGRTLDSGVLACQHPGNA